MNKLKTFFNTVVKSVSSPPYYKDVLKAKMSFSLKYFLMLTIVLSIITAVKIMIPVTLFNIPKAADELVKQYPADLDIKMNQGRLSINQPLPYVIPMKQTGNSTGARNFVVFDSDKNVNSPQDFYKYNTLALVTETSIYTNQDTNDSIKVYQIPQDAENVEINAGMLNQWKAQFLNMPVIKDKLYVPAIGLALLILLVPLMYLVRLSTAYTFAIFTYIILKVFKKSLVNNAEFSLNKLFQVSMHTTTVPILLAYITSFTSVESPIRGLLYFGIYFVFTVFVLRRAAMGSLPTVTATVVKPAPSKTEASAKKKK